MKIWKVFKIWLKYSFFIENIGPIFIKMVQNDIKKIQAGKDSFLIIETGKLN